MADSEVETHRRALARLTKRDAGGGGFGANDSQMLDVLAAAYTRAPGAAARTCRSDPFEL